MQWARLGRKRAARLRAEGRRQHAALARGAARQRKERGRQSRADAAAAARRAAAAAARDAVRAGLDTQISERQIERRRAAAAEAEAEAWRAEEAEGEQAGERRLVVVAQYFFLLRRLLSRWACYVGGRERRYWSGTRRAAAR